MASDWSEAVIFVGIDWAEEHHDVHVMNPDGQPLGRARVPEGIDGIARLHALVADHADDPGEVVVGIETDRGLLVTTLVAAGYQVYGINPRAVDRYRDRHAMSGAKSDGADAKVLADLVRTDRHNHRQVAGDSDLAEAIKVTARAHQNLVWARQRQVNQLRSALREYYPGALATFGTDLAHRDVVAVLVKAPTPELGRRLSTAQIAAALRRAGRVRNVDARAAQIDELESALADRFEQHPDADILRSLPGLAVILGARVLGEFGDDPNRYADAKARRNYAGSSPITKQSGSRKLALARYVRNRRLADAITLWAFSSLQSSPGARMLYDRRRAAGDTHHKALRALSNRWVGIMHGCLRHRTPYDERIAWGHLTDNLPTAA